MPDYIAVVEERTYSYTGLFNINHTYNYVKRYLGDVKEYTVKEKDYEEVNDKGKRKVRGIIIANTPFTDEYEKEIRYEIILEGTDISAEIDGKVQNICKGSAKLTINAYIKPEPLRKRGEPAWREFLGNIWRKYFNQNEFSQCWGSIKGDVQDTIDRFKQVLNATVK